MLHIILLILKIIGWILLAILGLIVLLICVVFFVPLCYRIEGKCGGDLDSLSGEVRFSWLFHLIGGLVEYDKGKLSWVIRIAWKKIREEDEDEDESESEDRAVDDDEISDVEEAETGTKVLREAMPHETEEHTESREFASDVRRLEELMKADEEKKQDETFEGSLEIPPEEPVSEETAVETVTEKTEVEEPVTETAIPKEQALPDADRKRKARQRKAGKDFAETHKDQKGFFERLGMKIQKLFEKLKYTFEKICDTMKSLTEKKEKLTAFITDEVHRSALAALLKEIKRLLRFLKPKKVEADIEYGFEEPHYTGQVLAALSMIYPFVGEHVDIQPDFEHKVLKGNLLIAGKIRVFSMVIILWNLVWNKNVRITFKHIRKFKL